MSARELLNNFDSFDEPSLKDRRATTRAREATTVPRDQRASLRALLASTVATQLPGAPTAPGASVSFVGIAGMFFGYILMMCMDVMCDVCRPRIERANRLQHVPGRVLLP